MQTKPELETLFHVDTESTLYRLANLQESESPFVSCYFDTRAGIEACSSFLNRKVAHIRGSMRGIERFEFDSAVEMIRGALDAHWSPQAQGMAVFARGVSNERHLSVMHTAGPVENRLVRYALPEVLPLIALHQREPAFTLLLVNDDCVRLFETRPGTLTVNDLLDERPSAGGIDPVDVGSDGDGSSRKGSRQKRGVAWRLRKALGASSSPLLIAGDIETLSRVADWLPPSVVARLVGSIPVSSGTSVAEALKTARDRVDAICRTESNQLADALTVAATAPASVAFGYRSTLEAIRHAEAAAVVIGDWDNPGFGLPWEAEIEICLAALRNGVRVVFGDSVRLREAGGVGCWLREKTGLACSSSQGRRADLKRVA